MRKLAHKGVAALLLGLLLAGGLVISTGRAGEPKGGSEPAEVTEELAPELALAATNTNKPLYIEDLRGMTISFCFFDDSSA